MCAALRVVNCIVVVTAVNHGLMMHSSSPGQLRAWSSTADVIMSSTDEEI